jgi:hypothetical protein
MYKKLMFLISFVAVLALVNVAPATEYDWTAGGDGTSWDDPANWNPSGVPGVGDTPTLNPAGSNPSRGPIIDVAVTCEPLKGGPDGDFMIDIVAGGSLTVRHMDEELGEEPDGTLTFNLSGGSLTVTEDRIRMANGGDPVIWNISGDHVMTVLDMWRMSDNDDAYCEVNLTGGTVSIPDGSFEVGDDGPGVVDISAGLFSCDEMALRARKGGTTSILNVSGTGQLNVAGELALHTDCKDDGGLVTANVSGGSITADELKLADGCGEAVLNMTAGSIVANYIEMPADGDGEATINMDGGLIQCDTLRVRNDGMVNLAGGTIQVTGNSLECDGGAINITTGTLVLKGDLCGSLPLCVTAYYVDAGGGCAGSRGTLNCVFDGENTIVTANAPDVYKAWSPTPADGAVHQSVDVELCWCRGDCAFRSAAYLSTDPVAVANALAITDPEFKGYYDVDCFTPASALEHPIVLDLWQWYYWRIDQIATPGCPVTGPPYAPPRTNGEVWSFMTGCELIPGDINLDCHVNFLDYGMMADDWRECVFFPDDVTP